MNAASTSPISVRRRASDSAMAVSSRWRFSSSRARSSTSEDETGTRPPPSPAASSSASRSSRRAWSAASASCKGALLARQPAQLDLAGGDVPRLLVQLGAAGGELRGPLLVGGTGVALGPRLQREPPARRSAPTPARPRPAGRQPARRARSGSIVAGGLQLVARASASSARRRSVASSSSRRATSGEAPDHRAARSSSSPGPRARLGRGGLELGPTCAPNSALFARHSARSRSSDTMRWIDAALDLGAQLGDPFRERVALVLQRVGQLRPRRELGDPQRLLLQLRLGLRQGAAGVVTLLAGDVALTLQRVPLGLQRCCTLTRLGGDDAQLVQLGRQARGLGRRGLALGAGRGHREVQLLQARTGRCEVGGEGVGALRGGLGRRAGALARLREGVKLGGSRGVLAARSRGSATCRAASASSSACRAVATSSSDRDSSAPRAAPRPRRRAP